MSKEVKTETTNTHEIEDSLIIPQYFIQKDSLRYDRKTSIWYQEDSPFSGYAEIHLSNGQLYEQFGVLNGRMQNQSIEWFPNGEVRRIAHYHHGKLHGENKIWSQDSGYVLIAHLNYTLGKVDGLQRKWYTTGEVYQELNFDMGKEKGKQKAYRKNGAMYANYEAINGRIFGLMRANLCVDLENQEVKQDDN